MDDLTVDFALAGVQAMDLGKGPSTDVLAVSLSTTDAIGHAYGPDSKELHDQILRLDRNLGRLIDSLYTLRDSTRIIFALGSDHGVTPFPEAAFSGPDPDRGRVDVRPVIDKARSALASRGIEGDALVYQDKIILVDRARLVAKGVPFDSVVTALRAQLLAIPGMARVDRVSGLAAAAAKGDMIARRWRQALPADMPAVLTVTFKPGYYVYTTRYATHGMPYDLDARIPVLFMGPGFRAGRFPQPIRSVDVAPTLAARLGIPPTEPLDGRVLSMVLTADERSPRLR
jgi:arylsulfatase A-like enzyme